jgi:hypothetical protein
LEDRTLRLPLKGKGGEGEKGREGSERQEGREQREGENKRDRRKRREQREGRMENGEWREGRRERRENGEKGEKGEKGRKGANLRPAFSFFLLFFNCRIVSSTRSLEKTASGSEISGSPGTFMGVIKGPPKNKLVVFNPEKYFNKEGWRRRGRKGKEKRN